jgi:hypothetical protein
MACTLAVLERLLMNDGYQPYLFCVLKGLRMKVLSEIDLTAEHKEGLAQGVQPEPCRIQLDSRLIISSVSLCDTARSAFFLET